VLYIKSRPNMETRDVAKGVASPLTGRQRTTPYTLAPTSSPTGGSTKKPHKFFLALGLPRGDWANKGKRDQYRLAIDKALEKARSLTGINLTRCWTSYPVEAREKFEDEFKRRLEEYLRYVEEFSLLIVSVSRYRLERYAECFSSKDAKKEPNN